jgi:hypothetical protein
MTISYRSNGFTSSVIGLKLRLDASLFNATLTVRLGVFDGCGPKARQVGQAAECDARDPATGEITQQAGVEALWPVMGVHDSLLSRDLAPLWSPAATVGARFSGSPHAPLMRPHACRLATRISSATSA